MLIKKGVIKASVLFSGMMLAIGARAQNSVTLYGILDGGLLYVSHTQTVLGGNGKKLVGFTDSGQVPSQIGLTGTEDLGGGLKAEFNLQSGINIGNGGFNDSNGNFFGRQAYVGLKGGFGEVKAGLQFSPFFGTLIELDPRGLSQLGSSLPIYGANASATGVFNANALSYTSPVIGGLQGSAMFALGGAAGNFAAGRQYSANLSYRSGGLTVAAALYDGNPGGTVVTNPSTNVGFNGRMIGAAYQFGKFTVKASFTNYKVAGGMNNDVYGGGLDYALTPAVDLNGGLWYITDRDNASNHSVMSALGATYSLSATTAIYAQVGVVNNHGSAAQGIAIGTAPTTLFAPAGTTIGADIGIRHAF